MKSNKESDAIKFAMIERWQQSKQTVSEFCKSENVAFHVFYYWHNKYKKQNKAPAKFIKIAAPLITSSPLNYCELYFTNGMRLVFKDLPDAGFIKQLL